MTRLKDDSGDWPNTDSKIEELMLVYFQNLFSSEGSSSKECLRMIMPTVSESDNTNLLAPFSETEIQVAIFSMHPNKSLEPDGMNPAFFQKFWHIVGKDISAACLSFLSNSESP